MTGPSYFDPLRRSGGGNGQSGGAPDERRGYTISEKLGEWEVCEVEVGTTIVCQGNARADAIGMARGFAKQHLQQFHNQSGQRS